MTCPHSVSQKGTRGGASGLFWNDKKHFEQCTNSQKSSSTVDEIVDILRIKGAICQMNGNQLDQSTLDAATRRRVQLLNGDRLPSVEEEPTDSAPEPCKREDTTSLAMGYRDNRADRARMDTVFS